MAVETFDNPNIVDRDAVATGLREARHPFTVSWGAVIAGVVTAVMVLLLVNLLFLGIGLQSIDPATEADPLAGLATGSAVATIIANLLALFAGGFVAGRLAGRKVGFASLMNGLLVWALLTLATIFLATTAAGRLASGVTSALGSALSTLGSAAGSVGQGIAAVTPELDTALSDALEQRDLTVQDLQAQVTSLLNAADEPEIAPENLEDTAQTASDAVQDTAADIAQNPAAVGSELNQLAGTLFRQGEDITEDLNRDDLIDAITAETGVSREEAQATVETYRETFQQVQAQVSEAQTAVTDAAQEATQRATDALGTAAIIAFIGLILGALVAMFGAATGKPSRDEVTVTT